MSHPLPPKKEVALALLERSSVHVHLDPRAAGVVVPLFLKSQPQLVLQIGLNMPVPIPDLRLDEAGMTCTLSFNRAPFYCVIPWTSIFAMIGDDGRGMIWKDDVPPEVAKPSQARPDRPAAAPAEIAGRPLRAAPNPDPEAGASGGKRAGEVKGAGEARGAAGAGGEGRGKVAKKPRKRVERVERVERAKQPRAGSTGATGSASESRGGASGREGKEARGGLSAVPSLPASTGEGAGDRPTRKSPREGRDAGRDTGRDAGSAADKRPATRPGAAPSRDEMPPPPAPRPAAPRRPGGPPRVKRELPPYLRVVK